MAHILIIDDERAILRTLELYFSKKGYTVYTAATGNEGLDLFRQHTPEVVILDIRLPDSNGIQILNQLQEHRQRVKVIMITAFQDMETTIQAMKNGAYDYIHKPLDIDEIEQTVEQALQVLDAERDITLPQEIETSTHREAIIGKSRAMLEIFKTIGMVCQNRTPVLIHGETGTGKGLIAKIIHQNSVSQQEPFVTLDCSAVVETLIESELFGHERGSFTGAHRTHAGKIEAADKGTLFLDEIGELPLPLQTKFLGLLQNYEYVRIGGTKTLQAHCRIIAATNRNLAEMAEQGRFREDLYYRLKVVTLHIPPLRARIFDIPLLVKHFLQKINQKLGTDVVKLHDGVLDCLMSHPWTGNVRELENALTEAIVRARGKVILLEDIEKILMLDDERQTSKLTSFSLANLEKEHIKKVLSQVAWNRKETSRLLGITPPTLRSKIRKYGIIVPDDDVDLSE